MNDRMNAFRGAALWLALAIILVGAPGLDAQELRDGKANPLIGPVSMEQIFDLDGWFGADFVSYTPDRSYTMFLKEYLQGVTIKCFLGTWCSDSETQVPRMLKVLHQAGVDPAQFEMYGLDAQKKSPSQYEASFHITHVPTFVLMHQDQEIGRIVEEPIGSLEKDLVGLIKKAFPDRYPFHEGENVEGAQSDADDSEPGHVPQPEHELPDGQPR